MHFVVLHPEFWNGGAERLIMSIIRALRQKGHSVEVYCSYMNEVWYENGSLDPSEVTVLGSSLMGGDWHIQMIFYALKVLFSGKPLPDVVIADSSPAALPILKIFAPSVKIYFYNHHPHHLMGKPLDFLMTCYFGLISVGEHWLLSYADLVVSNSEYTKYVTSRYMEDWLPSYKSFLLYPCTDVTVCGKENGMLKTASKYGDNTVSSQSASGLKILTVMGRFWPGKQTETFIDAVLHLRKVLPKSEWSKIRIRIAGSVDKLNPFSRRYAENIQRQIENEKLGDICEIFFNVSEDQKTRILQEATALIFTPKFEHFGIVPIEAMMAGTQIIAHNAAGPKESLAQAPNRGKLINWYCPISFAESMIEIMNKDLDEISSVDLEKQMPLFSFKYFSETFNESLNFLE